MFRNSPRLRRHVRGDILLGPVFFIGILAAIAIPAYQDYSIRSQVNEGLNLASGVKVSVAEAYATNGTWPANLRRMGYERTPRSHYVTSVTVRNGIVVIRYGGRANALVNGLQLTLYPTLSPQQEVLWNCGYAFTPVADPLGSNVPPPVTSLPPKYLPKGCR